MNGFKKIVLLVLDGAADRPVIAGQTPLQAASTPNLDRLASFSACGRLLPRQDMLGASTDLTHFVFLGYSPEEYPGRSVLEAAALGIPLRKDAVYLSCLLAYVDENGLIKREGIDIDENLARKAFELVSPYRSGFYSAKIHHQSGRYGVLELTGPVEAEITDTDPFKDGLPLLESKSYGGFRSAGTAAFLNEFTRYAFNTLKDAALPGGINTIISKWVSTPPHNIVNFYSRTSMKGAIVAQPTFFKGMARLLDMTFLPLPGVEPEEELEYLTASAEELLLEKDFDFVLLHTKLPDKAAHSKDPEYKVEILEKLDSGLAALLDSALFNHDEVVIAVTSDHPTPSTGNLIHTGEFTPLCVKSSLLPVDSVSRFNEVDCADGYLKTILSTQLMSFLLNCSDRVAFSGSRYSPYPVLGFMKSD